MGFIELELDYEIFVTVNNQLFIAIYIDKLFLFYLDIVYLEDMQ